MIILDIEGNPLKYNDPNIDKMYITSAIPYLRIGDKIKGKINNYIVVDKFLDTTDSFCEFSWNITVQIQNK